MRPSALDVYDECLAAAGGASGHRPSAPYRLRAIDGAEVAFPLGRWLRPPGQRELLALATVEAPVLDIGCGPGRHVAALRRRGVAALGIDLSEQAVRLAWRRGAPAIRGSVFGPVPRSGDWATALLLDGNIGIGGDPEALLGRVRHLLRPRGCVLIEVEPPGTRTQTVHLRIEAAGRVSEWFRWARVSACDISALASAARFHVATEWGDGDRRFARLRASGGGARSTG